MTEYNASEIDRLVREYQERGREFARRGGTWLGAARSWIKRHCLNGERVTWGSNDVLQHDFTVDDVERIALEVATAVFDEFAAMVAALSAAKAEVERLTTLHQAAYAQATANLRHWDDAALERDELRVDRDRLAAEVERLTKERDEAREMHALKHKWATEFAGEAQEYAALSDMRGDDRDRLSARVRELELTEEEREALGDVRDIVAHTDYLVSTIFDRETGATIRIDASRRDRVVALLDRLVKGGR